MMLLAGIYSSHRAPNPAELAVWGGGIIPEGVDTFDPNASYYLEACKRAPHLHEISKTQFNYDPRRFSWLKALKSDSQNLISKLLPGDMVLYHHKNSLTGKVIRTLTRCYWEHTAIYIGDGLIMDVSPGGIKKVSILEWLADSNIDLAFIRFSMKPWDSMKEFVLKLEGNGYNYIGVLRVAWHIFVGRQNPFGITLKRLTLTLLAGLCINYAFDAFNTPIRLQIMLATFFAIFVIDSIYHPIAYTSNLESIFSLLENESEKSRDKSNFPSL